MGGRFHSVFRGTRREFIGVVALAAGGGLSAIALLLLASNRLPGIPASEIPPAILAIQWYVFGLTLGKLGLDSVVFAIVSKDPGLTFRERGIIQRPFVVVVVSFLCLTWLVMGIVVSCALSLALVADAMATVAYAELNARRKFIVSALSGIFNYPLFILLWSALSGFATASFEIGICIFALCSCLRLWWLVSQKKKCIDTQKPVFIQEQTITATQSVLNLALFRSDQLLLATTFFTGYGMPLTAAELGLYTFMAKGAEVTIAFATLLGSVSFQRVFIAAPALSGSNLGAAKAAFVVFLLLMLGSGAVIAMIVQLYTGSKVSLAIAIPFLLQAPLAYVANMITFSIQRSERIPFLTRTLFVTVLIGLSAAIFLVPSEGIEFLAWIVPSQLILFTALAVCRPWGAPKRVYVTKD